MHYLWLQYFFRDVIEKGVLTERTMPFIYGDDIEEDEDPDADTAPPPDGEDEEDAPEDTGPAGLDDPELREAARIVRGENKASTALLQRRMNIGYAKAARLLDALERLDVVGPYNGSDPREVLPSDLPDEDSLPPAAGDHIPEAEG